MAEQEMQNKEPAAQAGGAAAVAKDVAEGLFVNVGSTIFTGIAFAQLVVLVVGTAIPWFTMQSASSFSSISLWKYHTESSTGTFTDVYVQDIGCSRLQEYFKGAETFAIISIFAALASFIFGLITRARDGSIKIGGAILAFITFGATLISWGIMARAYYLEFCGSSSWRDQHFFVAAGLALFVTAWILAFVNFVVSIQDPKVPKIIPDALADKFGAIVFTLLALVAFMFTVIATPISAFSKWDDADPTKLYKVTIWAAKVFVNGDMTSSTKLTDIACGDLPKYARFSEAFSIISIGMTLVAFVAGVLATTGTAGKKAPLALGFFAALTTLIKFASDTEIYYRQFCSGSSQWPSSLSSQYFHLDAGFALFVAASIAMWFGVILLGVIGLSQLVASPVEGGNTKPTAFLFIFGTAVSLTLMVVGLTQPVFSNTSGNDYTRVNWWNDETLTAGVYAKNDFSCKEEWQRLVGGGALTIIAIGLSLIAAFLGIGQLSSSNLRVGASAIALLASACQLIGWAIAVSDFWGQFCVGNGISVPYPYYNHNYNVASGIGLVVAAWGTNLIVSVLNLVVSP